tara:strand:+ start:1881 stop:2402 length:522 start_codon:yes stop_codon:yes gene_type:complete
MKKIILSLTLFLILLSSICQAAPKFGVQTDVGVPDGLAIGLVVNPNLSWLRINVSGTYNLMAPGIRAGLVLDPISYIISPIMSFEAGTYGKGTVPFLDKAYDISYDYINFHTGFEIGNKHKWKILLHLGSSLVYMKVYDFSKKVDNNQGLILKDPSISSVVSPTLKIGFVYFF